MGRKKNKLLCEGTNHFNKQNALVRAGDQCSISMKYTANDSCTLLVFTFWQLRCFIVIGLGNFHNYTY